MRSRFWFALVLGLGWLLVVPPGPASASTGTTRPNVGYTLGVSPSAVSFSRALRGADYEATLTLINGSAQDQYFRVRKVGTVANWLEVVQPGKARGASDFLVPKGAEGLPLELKAHVPPTVANGVYTGHLAVNLLHNGSRHGKVVAGVGTMVAVSVQVTDTQVIKGAVIDVSAYPKIEVGTVLPVLVRIKNSSNVTVQPKFDLSVSKKGSSAKPVYHWSGATGQGMYPSQARTYEVDWPARSTRGQTLGNYVASVRVHFPAGKVFGPYKVAVGLYPFGSLHRGGKLLGLQLGNHPSAGGTAIVDATVRSTGETQQETTFVGRLYRDGTLVGGVHPQAPILLSPGGQLGSQNSLTLLVPVTHNGLYRLTGSASFAGAQTTPMSLTFRVGPAPVPLSEILAGVLAFVAVAVASLVTWWSRRGRARRPRGGPRHGRREPAWSPPRSVYVDQRLRVPSKGNGYGPVKNGGAVKDGGAVKGGSAVGGGRASSRRGEVRR